MGERLERFLSDYLFFVRRKDKGFYEAVRTTDDFGAISIGSGVKLQAEPFEMSGDALPDFRLVLSDAGGEHECVEAAERCSDARSLASDA